MTYKLAFSKLAQAQISNALNHYDAISVSLGLKLEKELVTAYDLLKQHPYHYFNINKQFRRITLCNFPYQLIYTIIETENEVLIAALFHQHVNPKRIKRL